jgi:peptidoglycan/xylan/chitin deacetylase (PgdA/CDA1 family)
MLNAVPVLLYHSVSANPPDWIAPFSVAPDAFGAHLDAVVASGRQPVTATQFADGLRGKATLPARPVLITVDDGFADFAEAALPALTERRLVSTLYITTGALADRPRETVLPPAAMLRTADLAGLEASGVEIGAHSHTHRQMDLLPEREVAAELRRSGDLLGDALGHRVRSFAYPHGYYKPAMLRQVAAAGFDSACTVANALSGDQDHPLAFSRFMVYADTDPGTVAGWLSGAGASQPRPRILAFGWRQGRRLSSRGQAKAWLG